MKYRLDPGQIEVVDDEVAAILRKKTPAERIAMTVAASRTARILVEGGVRHRYPNWNDEQIRLEVVRRMTRGPK